MCGIVGIWQKDKRPVSEQLLAGMRDIMYFRGPDDYGIWIDKEIGFAHRRLSIIDLSSLGHQPMIDEETGAVITYNGEVYNYREIREDLKKSGIRFISQSDTEVILKAYRKWGRGCVEKLNGMFAFAIWDPINNGIFLARDRIGIKPLYYYNSNDVYMFASRLSPLILHPACPQDIDRQALRFYLDLGYVPSPWSILKGVKKLEPGHTLWVDKNGITENCYWSMDKISIDEKLKKIPEAELINRLDTLLQESVSRHLVSDVPLGAFLSGGVDSSLITALMCRCSKDTPRAFTIGFKEKQYDESKYAQKIAEYLGVKHSVEIMSHNDLLSLLDDNTVYYDEPLADISSLPTMMLSRFAKKHVSVALSGDGADELFCGYHHYLVLSRLRHIYKVPHIFRRGFGDSIGRINNFKLSTIGQCFSEKDMMGAFLSMRRITNSCVDAGIFPGDTLDVEGLFKQRATSISGADNITGFSRLDIAHYLPDDVLQKLDVASMCTGLEARVPLLDQKIVEFTQSLPMKYKIRGLTTKWLLKQVLSGYIPKGLFNRPKKGFVVPVREWFRKELKGMLREEFAPSRLKSLDYLNPSGVEKLIAIHLSNRRDTHNELWALLCLIKWDKSIRSLRHQNKESQGISNER